ncbi:arylsulfatase [Vibrio maritimus]|uniref:Arylsulfatase n=1 Tax=Vibrio maritimus TaxID=990268 RepID=A0A090SGR3_9VIBR|nr:arylsulfatase [Vibrio maritimus]
MVTLLGFSALANAEDKPPNIFVIFTDDIGISNLSAYHRGVMSSETPNIDSIAEKGMLLTDYYAQPSCTAGRSAFITGQFPVRTGMHTVGLPGSPVGLTRIHRLYQKSSKHWAIRQVSLVKTILVTLMRYCLL